MRASAPGCGLLAATTLAASTACEIVRPVDPVEAHPDVVAVAALLVAGEEEARLLAVHPHRKLGDEKPLVTASLHGSGWTAEFSRELRLPACGRIGGSWHVPTRCLGATLPEAIQPGVTYGLSGTAPLGEFGGLMTVPAPPELLEPGQLVSLPLPDEAGLIDIPLQYRIGLDIGTLLADLWDVLETEDDGTEVEIPVFDLGPFPHPLALAEHDTISIYQDRRPLRFLLRLLGVGWNYTNFVKYIGTDPLPRPWPSFGVEGEGVYGYFDGLVHSRIARVSVGEPGDPQRAQ